MGGAEAVERRVTVTWCLTVQGSLPSWEEAQRAIAAYRERRGFMREYMREYRKGNGAGGGAPAKTEGVSDG